MKNVNRWSATLAMAATAALSLSQGFPGGPPQGPGPGGQGGPGGFQRGPGGPGGFQGGPGGPGMRGGMMMGGGPQILRRPDVQKELKLSETQIDKLNQVLGGPGRGGFQRGPGGPGGPPPGQGGGFQGGPPQGPGAGSGGFHGGPPKGPGGPGGGFQRGPGGPGGDEFVKQLEKQIREILNDGQFKRYQQLALQMEGARALGRPDIADKVGLSDEKREKIGEIIRGSMGGMMRGPGGPPPGQGGGFQGGPPQGPPQGGPGQGPGGFQRGPGGPGGPGGDFGQMRQQMEKQRKELDAKILALLSADEKSKWNALLGKEFKFETLGPPRGGEDR